MSSPTIAMVLYGNPDYYPPTFNAVSLLAQNFSVQVIGRNQDPPHRLYPANVTVHRFGEYTSVREREQWSVVQKLWEYGRFIQDLASRLGSARLVYAYDGFAYNAVLAAQCLMGKRIPVVYHSHETDGEIASWRSLTGWIQRLECRTVAEAAIVVFPEKDRAIQFQQRAVPAMPIPQIVPNFPLRSVFRFDLDWERCWQDRWRSPTVFYRGTISDGSAMKESIAAVASFPPTVKLRFVGFASESVQAACFAEADTWALGERFAYLGRRAYDELQDLTLRAGVGLALYKGTSFGALACATACNKIYEYAACGLPVVVSDLPNYREFLGQEPWVRFADPNDSQSIAAAIAAILQDFETYRTMAQAARHAFETKFNYEIVFAPVAELISNLVKPMP
ncbi:MAG TPA: glycosyltransferase [Cyanobacteria bacterium UBA8156]|jgi:glycosyltransferase involved in cell wall biosynthesis|nr:glycosyltransferase [Cyanobacteria bacterium UBA8156]